MKGHFAFPELIFIFMPVYQVDQKPSSITCNYVNYFYEVIKTAVYDHVTYNCNDQK